MALIKCKECGNEVSTLAKACPKCGAPIEEEEEEEETGCGTVVLIMLGIFILIVIFINYMHTDVPRRRSESSPSDIPLGAKIQNVGGGFVITNNDSYGWGNCKFELNSDYSIKGINVAPNQTIIVTAENFTDGDGTRFNMLTTKPQQLYVRCETSSGTRSTLVGWK